MDCKIDLASAQESLKKIEYCQKCGRECAKKIINISKSYDQDTGKESFWCVIKIFCVKKGLFNFSGHTDYTEPPQGYGFI